MPVSGAKELLHEIELVASFRHPDLVPLVKPMVKGMFMDVNCEWATNYFCWKYEGIECPTCNWLRESLNYFSGAQRWMAGNSTIAQRVRLPEGWRLQTDLKPPTLVLHLKELDLWMQKMLSLAPCQFPSCGCSSSQTLQVDIEWYTHISHVYILLSALASLFGPFCFLVFGPRNYLQIPRNYLQSSRNYLKNMRYIEGS